MTSLLNEDMHLAAQTEPVFTEKETAACEENALKTAVSVCEDIEQNDPRNARAVPIMERICALETLLKTLVSSRQDAKSGISSTKTPEGGPNDSQPTGDDLEQRIERSLAPIRSFIEEHSYEKAVQIHGDETVHEAYQAMAAQLKVGDLAARKGFERMRKSGHPFDVLIQWYAETHAQPPSRQSSVRSGSLFEQGSTSNQAVDLPLTMSGPSPRGRHHSHYDLSLEEIMGSRD